MLTEIISGLWIGDITDAFNETFYKDNLINIVINCTLDQEFINLPNINKTRIPLSSNLTPERDMSLLKNNMLQEIESKGIVLMELIPHDEFIKKLIESKLIITDGGSISEECSVLGLNTIIWRDVVENINYLNENVILSDYDFEKIYKFIDNLPTRKSKSDIERSPSEELVNLLIPYIQSQ